MIQRIQTVWLLLAAACAILTLQLPVYSGTAIPDQQTAPIFTRLTAQNNLLLLILTCGVGIASLITVFLYKDRKTQFRICLVTLLVSVINLVLFYRETTKFVEGNMALTAALAIAVPIFLLLAARGIRRDEKLVKSLDRLR